MYGVRRPSLYPVPPRHPDIEVAVTRGTNSMTTFADLGVPARIASALAARDITTPFPIQEASIPDGLAGKDILGKAPTGSGKTLAFGIPLVTRVERSKPGRPRALVLAPTRELAEQIAQELMPLAKKMDRWVLAVYGGVGYDFQRRQLRRGADIVVATPGRLTDLIDEGTLSLERIDIAVIDEADRMADMGFMPQVKKLLDQMPTERQTILFSATLDGDVGELIRRYQKDPVRHEVETDEDHTVAAHYFWEVDHYDRLDTTARILDSSRSAIVFTKTRHGADRVANQLERAGVLTASIHGGRSQGQRTRALKDFGSGRIRALIATDVAARGIHVDAVSTVIHYDIPADHKDYLHRSGRTARAGKGGVVVSLITADQRRAVKSIQRAVGLDGRMHDPNEDWLTGETGSRVGEHPVQVGAGTGDSGSRGRRGNGGGGRGGSRGYGARGGDGRGGDGRGAGTRGGDNRGGDSRGAGTRSGAGRSGESRGYDSRGGDGRGGSGRSGSGQSRNGSSYR
jgi:superfamily II DNA/RNA helicase